MRAGCALCYTGAMLIADPNLPYQLSNDGRLLLLWNTASAAPRTGLLCVIQLCTSRDCSCTEVTLVSYAIDERLIQAALDKQTISVTWERTEGSPPHLGEATKLLLDYQTGELRCSGGQLPDWVRGCVDGALLDRMYAAWLQAKRYKIREAVLPDPQEWQPDELLSWRAVFPDSRRDLYRLSDQSYLADTFFCIQPTCTCTEARLAFYKMEGNHAYEAGSVRLDLPSWRPLEYFPDDLGQAALERLLAAFQERHQRTGMLHDRRRRLREMGPTLLAPRRAVPVRAQARIGRNDPCPCGSGKKYKRCCEQPPAP